jgi:hypothetical protein
MLGEHWDELPLSTWQKLAGYENVDSGPAPLSNEAMWSLLRDLRSDFGADSSFYQEVVRRVRRGERFVLERTTSGEVNVPIQDIADDQRIYEGLFNHKWRALIRRCPIKDKLQQAVPRMLYDPTDDLDYRVFLSLTLQAPRSRDSSHPHYKLSSSLALLSVVDDDRIYFDRFVRGFARLAANHPWLANRANAGMSRGQYDLNKNTPYAVIDQHIRMNRWLHRDATRAYILKELDRRVAGIISPGYKDQEAPVRPFCANAQAFEHEAAVRGHAHPDAAIDDDCWTPTLLRQMRDATVDPDEQREVLWDASTLNRHMAQCETPRELHKPLQEFRRMMEVVRDKFPTAAQREKQADELLARFSAAHGIPKPSATPRGKAKPLSLRQRRGQAMRAIATINVGAGLGMQNAERLIQPEMLTKIVRGLDAPVQRALRTFASEVREAAEITANFSYLDWKDRAELDETRDKATMLIKRKTKDVTKFVTSFYERLEKRAAR